MFHRARSFLHAATFVLVLSLEAPGFAPVTTSFTHQAQISGMGGPLNGLADFEFRLFDLPAGGVQVGPTVTFNSLQVNDGLLTVGLDFGPVFDGNQRWLETKLRSPAGVGLFFTMTPRINLTGAPYALFALKSGAPWVTSGTTITYMAGAVGIGELGPLAPLHIDGSGVVSQIVERTGAAGMLVEFRRNAAPVGSISVDAGGVVSYNAFTGSHFAWADGELDYGTLVSLTGTNCAFSGRQPEVIYGVSPSAVANDSRCLGAYAGLLSEGEPASLGNPHLVSAVGNGQLWIADSGAGDIQPGDYLLASDTPGCAMKDDPSRFPVGHVVARAAEAVKWSEIPPSDPGRPRRVRASVFFESFERQGDAVRLQQVIDAQQKELVELRERIAALESLVLRTRPALEGASR